MNSSRCDQTEQSSSYLGADEVEVSICAGVVANALKEGFDVVAIKKYHDNISISLLQHVSDNVIGCCHAGVKGRVLGNAYAPGFGLPCELCRPLSTIRTGRMHHLWTGVTAV